jgi:hypothetical protein
METIMPYALKMHLADTHDVFGSHALSGNISVMVDKQEALARTNMPTFLT